MLVHVVWRHRSAVLNSESGDGLAAVIGGTSPCGNDDGINIAKVHYLVEMSRERERKVPSEFLHQDGRSNTQSGKLAKQIVCSTRELRMRGVAADESVGGICLQQDRAKKCRSGLN
ncbi:MAG: hypothetical protein ACI8WM_001092 [Burkholderiaceae bacterium]|jgi:hypothetical protein